MSLWTYIAALMAWSALHLVWQGALIAAAYVAWKHADDPAASVRHRATIVSLAAIVGALVLNALLAHAALLGNAKRGAEGALGAPMLKMDAFDRATDTFVPVVTIWALGIAVGAGRVLLGQLHLRRLRASGADAPDDMLPRIDALARRSGIRVAPRVIVSAARMAPFVTGGERALLVLPKDFAVGEEFDALVLHELAHLRRGDLRTQHFVRVAGILVWWHPAVSYLAREAVNAREESCDDEAVHHLESPLLLARALVRLEERRRSYDATIGAGDGMLSRRIRRLIVQQPHGARCATNSLRRLARAALLVVLAVTALGVAQLAPASDRLAVLGAEARAVSSERMVISAEDSAGRFTITLLNGRVAGATVAGVPIMREAIRLRDRRLSLSNARGEAVVAVTLDPRGAIRWEPRRVATRGR